MFPPPERLARLLERHSYLEVVGAEGAEAIVLRDQILVSGPDSHRAKDVIGANYFDRDEPVHATDIVRLRLRPSSQVNLLEALGQLGTGTAPLAAGVNHMMRGEPGYQGGPASVPEPVDEPRAPRGERRQGPLVAVFDTGVAPEHPWMQAASWSPLDSQPVDDLTDDDQVYGLDAQAGHGTFVTGIIRREAPDADLVVGRVLSSDGVCSEVDLIRSLVALREHCHRVGRRLDVLNLSLGGYTIDDRPSPLVSAALHDLGRHTVVVAAAGNNHTDRPFFPAAAPRDVVGVGALDQSGSARAEYSNYGSWVDVWAVGTDVQSSFVTYTGPVQSDRERDVEAFHGYASWSGTSFAAPLVTGRIAAEVAQSGWDAVDSLAHLKAHAPRVDGLGPRFDTAGQGSVGGGSAS